MEGLRFISDEFVQHSVNTKQAVRDGKKHVASGDVRSLTIYHCTPAILIHAWCHAKLAKQRWYELKLSIVDGTLQYSVCACIHGVAQK